MEKTGVAYQGRAGKKTQGKHMRVIMEQGNNKGRNVNQDKTQEEEVLQNRTGNTSNEQKKHLETIAHLIHKDTCTQFAQICKNNNTFVIEK